MKLTENQLHEEQRHRAEQQHHEVRHQKRSYRYIHRPTVTSGVLAKGHFLKPLNFGLPESCNYQHPSSLLSEICKLLPNENITTEHTM